MGIESMLPLVFGLAALLVLQLIVVQGSALRRVVVGLFAGGLAIGIAVVGWWLAPPRYLPDASTSGLAMAVAQDIRKGLATEEPSHFLILDGGSYSVRGVSDVMLEERLSQALGAPYEVLAVSIPGGNQLERWSVLKRAMALLDARERQQFDAAPKTLLFEIHARYDRYPLGQLMSNPRSDRVYAYLGSDVLLEAARATPGEMERGELVKERGTAASVAAVNLMNVGRATRTVPADEVEGAGGYLPLNRPARGYRFEGTAAARQSLGRPPLSADKVPWRNVRLRRERYERVLGQKPEVIYFSVPTPRAGDMSYVRGFCKAIVAAGPCLTHADRDLLERLDDGRYWYDNGHMQRRGAELYTRWLSGRLADVLTGGAQR